MAEYIENGNATQLAEDMFSTFDFDLSDVPGKEYIESLDSLNTFYEYTLKYAQRAGFDGADDDANALAKFIFEKSNQKKSPLSSLATVKNWLTSATPSGNQSGRENVYRLCFTLGLNALETKVFFLKAYLERPFNYKNINESVYFFCMKNGLEYTDAERIIAKIESVPFERNEDAVVVTEQVGMDISALTTEDEVVKYLIENRSGFTVSSQTATEKIKALAKECKTLAEQEHKLFAPEDISVKNIDELLTAITGYYAREEYNGEKVFKTSISKSRLPDAVKRNFPQREQFKQIESGTASFDTIRKFLILLKFYHFFADVLVHNPDSFEQYWFDEFVDETNMLLQECGYAQLYWRNPYDWIFGHCATAFDLGSNPLDEFRNIITEFYLDDDSAYKKAEKKDK